MRWLLRSSLLLCLAGCAASTRLPPPLANQQVVAVLQLDTPETWKIPPGLPPQTEAYAVVVPPNLCWIHMQIARINNGSWAETGYVLKHEAAHCQGWRHPD